MSKTQKIHSGNVTTVIMTLLIDGFLFVDDLLAHPQFSSYSLEDVERVVSTNDKQRFKLHPHPEDGRLQIRANQGHSVQVGQSSRSRVREDTSDKRIFIFLCKSSLEEVVHTVYRINEYSALIFTGNILFWTFG